MYQTDPPLDPKKFLPTMHDLPREDTQVSLPEEIDRLLAQLRALGVEPDQNFGTE